MLSALIFHGILFVSFLLVYGRWLDDELLAEVCLFSLIFELVATLLFSRYIQVTDGVFFLHLGSSSVEAFDLRLAFVLSFDEVSGFFLSILLLALLFCFFFLVEYFEYELRAQAIILLSGLFSQLALLFFCSFDLLSMLIF